MYCIISINVAQKQTLFWSPHSTRLYVRLVNVELKLVLRPNTSNCMRVAAGAKPIRPDTFTHNTHSNIHYTRCIHIQRRGMYRLYTHTICVYRSVFFLSLSFYVTCAIVCWCAGVCVCVAAWGTHIMLNEEGQHYTNCRLFVCAYICTTQRTIYINARCSLIHFAWCSDVLFALCSTAHSRECGWNAD